MIKSVYIIPKYNAKEDERVVMIVDLIKRVAEPRQLIVLDQPTQCNADTLIVAIGGDGTMLSAMRLASRQKSIAMGINLGRVGFLTSFRFLEAVAEETMEDIFDHGCIVFPIEERLMLHGWSKYETITAGNEISISRGKSDSMITYRLIFDDTDAGIYQANSLLVSSPSGSTAYSLSAGGALMMPTLKAMQVVPVAPLTLTARPIIISHNTKVEIQAWGGDITTRADGIEWTTGVGTKKDPFTLFVQSSDPVRIMQTKNWNYFDMLSEKLHWQNTI
jgi:NAD+ kinase